MADFKVSLAKLLKQEGGYVNDAADAGGETYAGISRKFNPHWSGWIFIDRLKEDHKNYTELNEALAANPLVQQAVDNFYQQTFWQYDELPQELADKLLSISVNFGRHTAILLVQESLVNLGAQVQIDGSLGPKTLQALSKYTSDDLPKLLARLRAFASLRHTEIVLHNPDQQKFLKGWLLRDAE